MYVITLHHTVYIYRWAVSRGTLPAGLVLMCVLYMFTGLSHMTRSAHIWLHMHTSTVFIIFRRESDYTLHSTCYLKGTVSRDFYSRFLSLNLTIWAPETYYNKVSLMFLSLCFFYILQLIQIILLKTDWDLKPSFTWLCAYMILKF